MAEQEGQEKTETATDKKRQDSRKEGQVAFSREVNSAATIAAAGMIFAFTGTFMYEQLAAVFHDFFTNLYRPDLSVDSLYELFIELQDDVFPVVMPIFLAVLVAGVFFSVIQVGWSVNSKPLEPKLNKISPMSGLKRLFSSQTLAEFLKSMMKFVIVGFIAWWDFNNHLTEMQSLSLSSFNDILKYNFAFVAESSGKIILALIAIAVADFAYQKWHHEEKIKMTKQEVKEETKQSEGDPHIKARIREVQREQSKARMMQEVPKADTVVVNPTHFAVALRYDRDSMIAPQVTAKGVDYLALRMKAIARENNVPVIEKPALARELYSNVEIGQGIPEKFYKAVAEILAYVYRLKAKK